jgi:hypothetical protein
MHALRNSKHTSRDEAAVDGLVVSGLVVAGPELRCRRVTDEDAHGALVAAMLGAVNDDRTGQ